MLALRKLIESAFKTYLDSQSLGATVYPGFSPEDKFTPCVICYCRDAEEDPIGSGNYRVNVAIEIKDAASAASLFDDICAATKAAIWTTDIAASLMGSPTSFQVWGVAAESKIEWETADDLWIERHTMQLYCCERAF